MSDEDDYSEFEPEDERPKQRDRKIDEAKAALLERFFSGANAVYYGRQLEVLMENQFFHWITKRGLNELVEEGKIGFNEEQLEHHVAHFYYPKKYRYPRRQITAVMNIIRDFSEPGFTRAVGHHGEMLMESAFARTGFRVLDQKVRTVGLDTWTESNHDLDFLIERDGVRYGVEVKNQLGYIGLHEFRVKLAMNEHFGTRPFFVARKMPQNYIYQVNRAGGYCLITDNQNYPLLATEFAKRVREALQLPIAVIQRLPNTALVRFENWHEKQLGK